jgi:hypothetical protein
MAPKRKRNFGKQSRITPGGKTSATVNGSRRPPRNAKKQFKDYATHSDDDIAFETPKGEHKFTTELNCKQRALLPIYCPQNN